MNIHMYQHCIFSRISCVRIQVVPMSYIKIKLFEDIILRREQYFKNKSSLSALGRVDSLCFTFMLNQKFKVPSFVCALLFSSIRIKVLYIYIDEKNIVNKCKHIPIQRRRGMQIFRQDAAKQTALINSIDSSTAVSWPGVIPLLLSILCVTEPFSLVQLSPAYIYRRLIEYIQDNTRYGGSIFINVILGLK